MTTKIKGMCKGSFKYISNIFVVKEREMEIGLPTDVKHVAHIGWDGPEGTTPSWMNEFGGGSDLAVRSIGGSAGGSREQTWTSQDVTDFERSFGRQTSTTKLSNFPPSNSNSKKVRRKKTKSSNSSPKSGSARSSRSSKSRSMLGESEEGESRRNSVYV